MSVIADVVAGIIEGVGSLLGRKPARRARPIPPPIPEPHAYRDDGRGVVRPSEPSGPPMTGNMRDFLPPKKVK